MLLHVHVYLGAGTACSGHQHLLHGETIVYIIGVTICFQALDIYGATLPQTLNNWGEHEQASC